MRYAVAWRGAARCGALRVEVVRSASATDKVTKKSLRCGAERCGALRGAVVRSGSSTDKVTKESLRCAAWRREETRSGALRHAARRGAA